VIPTKAFEVLRMIGVVEENGAQAQGAGLTAALGYGKCFGFIKEGAKITKGEALFPKILPAS
jgi:hypothetical protein